MGSNEEIYSWTPDQFGFVCVRKSGVLEECVWKKGKFQLVYLGNHIWLCTKKIRKSNLTEQIVVNFSKRVLPEDEEFAEWLLEKRL